MRSTLVEEVGGAGIGVEVGGGGRDGGQDGDDELEGKFEVEELGG